MNDWYCSYCEKYLEDDEVTFEETHDERVGGCGYPVAPNLPPTVFGMFMEERASHYHNYQDDPPDYDPYGYDTLEEKWL